MQKIKAYPAIDTFKIVAAILVVCVHTSPLASFSLQADFVLTRIIARVAVPFFFMTSGFFLIKNSEFCNKRLLNFLRKTSFLYIAAIVLFIPLNIYNNYFAADNLFLTILKDVVFNGTIYHLWYLPAAIIGGSVAWFLCKKAGFTVSFIICLVLYAIGLFGDSYFGLLTELSKSGITFFEKFYNFLFVFFDYTRNGLFFAPIFFVLGGILANKKLKLTLKTNIIGFSITFIFMLLEGLFLQNLNYPRHDSMYIFLLPCMFFLFSMLISFKGKRIRVFKDASMIIYIIHPMMIVLLRLIAKVLSLQKVLLDNSLVFFLLVLLLSTVFSLIISKLFFKKQANYNFDKERAWLEINLDILADNVKKIQSEMPQSSTFMAVVKSDAYGHGAVCVAKKLNEIGVFAFATATAQEAITLRKNKIKGEILVLGYTDPKRARDLYRHKIMPSLTSLEHAKALNDCGYKIKAHLQLDTGMHRLGIDSDNLEDIISVFNLPNISLSGIYTHLCVCDSQKQSDIDFTYKQISNFYRATKNISDKGFALPKMHIQSSYGLLNYPQLNCDYVRVGISLYGVNSAYDDTTFLQLDLQPVLSLKAKVVCIKTIETGETVGYGRTFVAKRQSKIAVLPIGYADGLPRNLSGSGAQVIINGKLLPIIGRICMDQLMVDITDLEKVAVGDIATLIGQDKGASILAQELCKNVGTITNELLARMGTRLKKVAVYAKK